MKSLSSNLLRYHQRDELKGEKDHLTEQMHNPEVKKKALVARELSRVNQQLNDQSPEPLTGVEKDKLMKMEKDMRGKWLTGMPTQEQMRKNPPGAVYQHMKWEKQNKTLIPTWKNVMIQLNPDSSDPDLCNVERYRPSGPLDTLRTDAQITGHMSYGNVPDSNWDEAFEGNVPENTAVKQVKRRHLSDEQKQVRRDILAKAREVRKVKMDLSKSESKRLDVQLGQQSDSFVVPTSTILSPVEDKVGAETWAQPLIEESKTVA